MIKHPNGESLASGLRCVVPQEDGEIGCGSSDAMAVYYHHDHDAKKHQIKCFSCNQTKYLFKDEFEALDIKSLIPQDKVYSRNRKPVMSQQDKPFDSAMFIKGNPRPFRGLTLETVKTYGVGTRVVPNTETIAQHIYPYYDTQGNLIAQKVRHIIGRDGEEVKRFEVLGDKGSWNKITLFGQNVFPAGSARYVTVTEGEVDAMSAYQMLGSKYPCVSIPTGVNSVRKMLENTSVYTYLDSFENIVVCFDNDEAGQRASEVFCEIFPHKAKVVPMTFKDANEYLEAGKGQEFVRDAWWKARVYHPDGLALSSEFIPDVIESTVARGAIPYPYRELNRKMFGMRQAELTTWVAGTGSGKSTIIRDLVNHIRLTTPMESRIGMLMLEESPNKTVTGLVGLQLKKPLLLWDLDQQLPPEERVLKDLVITKEERAKAAQEILGDDRFVIMKNSFQGADLDNILKKVRQMNKVYNCQTVVLDHISIIVSGQDQGDERKALDEITTNLRRLVEETGINLHIVSHLKRPDGKGFEDGAEISLSDIRGTGAIAQLSDNVVGLERVQQHEDKFLSNVIKLRCLKCRVTGLQGLAGYLFYNHTTGCIETLSDEEYDARVEQFEQNKRQREDRKGMVKNDVDFPHDKM